MSSHSTTTLRTLEVILTSQPSKRRAQLLQRKKLQLMERTPKVQKAAAQQDHWTLKASQSLSIRVRDWTPKVDQETSTTLLVRFWSISLNNPTTIISTETKANSIHLSKSSRPKCASTISKTMHAHFNSIASLLTDLLNSDSQMT